APQLNQFSGELEQSILWLAPLPVQPADLVVLTISVVVPLLGAAELVAGQKHGHALRQKEHRQKIALLSPPQTVDVRIVRWTFNAAVPGTIVIIAVAVLVAIGFVVLVIVADEIVQ